MIRTSRETETETFRHQMVREVRTAARENGDAFVYAACARLERANIIGWKRHADAGDKAIVRAFFDAIRA